MVLFFMSLNGFFLKELLLHPGSTEFKPINMLSIVSALGFATQAAGVGDPSGKDKASARNGKTGGFIGALKRKTTLQALSSCATEKRMRPWASRRAAC
jgi:hypothetical protein